MATAAPQPGQIVHVRQRNYLVERVYDRKPGDSDTHLALACIEDDAQGQELELIWEHELDARILSEEDWRSIAERGFDPPARFAAYYDSLHWNCLTAADPKLFQAPFRAGIREEPYQLEPLRKALELPRVNLFIADDVGLGKTIEAGFILRELLLRKRIREILVAAPASMLEQWQQELQQRFGLNFTILDRAYLQHVRREHGLGVNPWSTRPRFLVSHALLRDPVYSAPLRDRLGNLRPGCMLVLDEAHHAAPASGQRYAVDSDFTRAIRDIAPRFEHRLFLSATPHNGHSNSFSALLELLDPQRFVRGVPVDPKSRDRIMVRRLKEDLRAIQGGFPERVLETALLDAPPTAPELRLAELVQSYRAARSARLAARPTSERTASALAVANLQYRLLSSIEAFAFSLARHRRSAEKAQAPAPPPNATDLLNSPAGPDDERTATPGDLEEAESAQLEAALAASSAPTDAALTAERDLLRQMYELAEQHRDAPDAKLRYILDWVRQHLCPSLGTPGAAWTDRRLIIFTEWEDTRRYIQRQLEAAIESSERGAERLLTFTGSTPPDQRAAIRTAWDQPPALEPLRILLCTDAAREGLNLQAHCWHLFHYDLPWNPAVLEQRNGRIDRKLQPKPKVYCRYFIYRNRPEDRVLQTLVTKSETIALQLGSAPAVIARVHQILSRGLDRASLAQTESEISAAGLGAAATDTVAAELDSARERQDALRARIASLAKQLENSRARFGVDRDRLRANVSAALGLLDAPPLKPAPAVPGQPPRFTVPRLDQRPGADPSWAATLDSLRKPIRNQTFAEWRATAELRPVVFEDPGVVTEEVVQLHLEQTLVQRLLSRFRSQGFLHRDLSRACLVSSTDRQPRVLLLGRLALFGPRASRLHEELLLVAAPWSDPARRGQPLAPLARASLDLLENALRSPGEVPPEVASLLQAAAPTDAAQLLPHLTVRASEAAAAAEAQLNQRAEIEAQEMRRLLESQRQAIHSAIAERQKNPQLDLEFDLSERIQRGAERSRWAQRLEEITHELDSEPARIRDVYHVQAQRLEPAGLVYLWPKSA